VPRLPVRNAQRPTLLVAWQGSLTIYHCSRLFRCISALCFLSYVTTGEGDVCYCPQHGLALANMQHARDLVLRVRISQDELRRLVDDVRRRADKPREWSRRLRDQLRQTLRPQLRAMQLMLQEADKIPVPIPEVAPLRAMVEKAAAWADKILKILARRQRKRPARGGSGDAANKDGAADGAGTAGEGKATLAEVEALLEEADAIPFEVPEVAELRLVVKGVAAFQERARRFLTTANSKDYTLDELTEVLHQGRSLEVEVDEVAELNRLIQRIQWSEKGALACAVDLVEGVRLTLSFVTLCIVETGESEPVCGRPRRLGAGRGYAGRGGAGRHLGRPPRRRQTARAPRPRPAVERRSDQTHVGRTAVQRRRVGVRLVHAATVSECHRPLITTARLFGRHNGLVERCWSAARSLWSAVRFLSKYTAP